MSSSVAAAKKGLRNYLRSWPGLRTTDGVTIRSAPVTPTEMTDKQVMFGDVSAPPKVHAGMARWEEKPTADGWIEVTRPGADEDAIDAARDLGSELLTLVEDALHADPTAAGTIPPPAQATVSFTALAEYPFEIDGSAGRRAQYRFTITWTSHIT
jgi:hypothetical protein